MNRVRLANWIMGVLSTCHYAEGATEAALALFIQNSQQLSRARAAGVIDDVYACMEWPAKNCARAGCREYACLVEFCAAARASIAQRCGGR
jgi:hypothetical protein